MLNSGLLSNRSLRTKLIVIMGVAGFVVSALFSFYLYRRGIDDTIAKARIDAADHLQRSVEMFMVSTRKFHDEFTASAGNPEERKTVLDDWNRSILAETKQFEHFSVQNQEYLSVMHAVFIFS